MSKKSLSTPTKVMIGFVLLIIGLLFVAASFGFSILLISSGIFMIVFSIVHPIAAYMEYGSSRRKLYITCCIISILIFAIGLGFVSNTHGGMGGLLFGLLFIAIGGMGLISIIITIIYTEITMKNTRRQGDEMGQHKGEDENGPKN